MKEENKIKLAKISGDMNDRDISASSEKVEEWQEIINEIIEDEMNKESEE